MSGSRRILTCVQVPSPNDPEESWYRCCLECILFYMSRHLRMLVLDKNNVRIQKNPGSVLIEVPNLYWNVVVAWQHLKLPCYLGPAAFTPTGLACPTSASQPKSETVSQEPEPELLANSSGSGS